jgi:hypothetical protein
LPFKQAKFGAGLKPVLVAFSTALQDFKIRRKGKMKRKYLSLMLFLVIGFIISCVETKKEGGKMVTVIGQVKGGITVPGGAGETTGWALIETNLKIDWKTVQSIEIAPESQVKEYDGKRVEVKGELTWRQGVERGYWPVIEVKIINEIK